ncbi:MAG: type I restriction enzyme HsdR N-terminal domain-containing protein [Rhizobiaceae bacterium]
MDKDLEIWEQFDSLKFENEGDVETRFVVPLLETLGYSKEDIASKPSAGFYIQEGRKGRKSEADYIVYSEENHTIANSLITVEAKGPKVSIFDGKDQAESYALSFRTPFVLCCNGRSLALWQLQVSTECDLLFEIHQGSYLKMRDQIEGALQKHVAISHCSKLKFKNFDLTGRDYSAYELSENKRLAECSKFLPRRLITRNGDQEENLDYQEVLSRNRSALIVAKSGYGKSVLAKLFCKSALEKRFQKNYNLLPVEIVAEDLKVTNQTIKDYAIERIRAHCCMAKSVIEKYIKENGFLLIVDGINRIPHIDQTKIVNEINRITRDFRRVRFIVLTSQIPTTQLESAEAFELPGFDEDDRQSLAKLHDVPYFIWANCPRAIYEMAGIPVLAERIVFGFKDNGFYYQRINDIFEDWVRSSFAGFSHAERALAFALMDQLALSFRSSSISVADFDKLAGELGCKAPLKEQILGCGLLEVSNRSVEFVHETVATYVRAKYLMSNSVEDIDHYIANYRSEENHLFAALLMAESEERREQELVWKGVLKEDICQAFGSLRYRADLSIPLLELSEDSRALWYFSDMLDAITVAIDAYFQDLKPAIYRRLCGCEAGSLGIAGVLRTDPLGIEYGFFDASSSEATVLTGSQHLTRCQVWSGRELKAVGLRADSGRIVGLKHLYSAVLNVCDRGEIRGQQIWLEEKTMSRFLYLARQHDQKELEGIVSLTNAVKILTSLSDARAGVRLGRRDCWFCISDLLSDLSTLMDMGVASVRPWWVDPQRVDIISEIGRHEYASMVDSYYSRSQLLYFEYLESFSKLREFFPGAQNRPHRYSVNVTTLDLGNGKLVWDYSSMPVAEISEVGAEVKFESNGKSSASHFEANRARAYSEAYREKLVQVGRISNMWSYSFGSGLASSFLQNSENYPNESPITKRAKQWLQDDLKTVFRELPDSDYSN